MTHPDLLVLRGCPGCAHGVDDHRPIGHDIGPGCDSCDCTRSYERVRAQVVMGHGVEIAGPPAAPVATAPGGRSRSSSGHSEAQKSWARGTFATPARRGGFR